MDVLDGYLSHVATALSALPRHPIKSIAQALWETYQRDGTIWVCGNGGSASTASHFACDLAKGTLRPECRRVRALALTDNMALMTAWSNDQSYADVFVEQLRNQYRPGDLLVAISGSGNSPNVLRAMAWANERGAPTVGLVGFDGGMLGRIAQHVLWVNENNMPLVEDVHSTVCHALTVELGRRIEQSMLVSIPRLVEVIA